LGRLGYGNTMDIGDTETPADAGDVCVGGPATQIAAGEGHTCALLETGAVRCWGVGAQGRLGYAAVDNIGDAETPADVGDVNTGAGSLTWIATGGAHTCAVKEDTTIRCWGVSDFGQLGYGNTTTIGDNEVPGDLGGVQVGGPVSALDLGVSHTCALTQGFARCWGQGLAGRLGYGNEDTIGDNEPAAAPGPIQTNGSLLEVVAGGTHTCALMTQGTVRCWGEGGDGQLGLGDGSDIGDDELPKDVSQINVGGDVIDIDAGYSHTCAVMDGGGVRCWGLGAEGQLGYSNTDDVGKSNEPADVGDVMVGVGAKAVSAGEAHTCVLTVDDKVRCWGSGGNGRLGYGNTTMIGDDEHPSVAGDVSVL
jgi:alpha-tubulin suppressor-like RCC1 family protein